MFKIQFLGTGGAFTRYDVNYHNNAIIHLENGKYIMIDCGTTALQALHELDIKPWQISCVLLTHMHGDHCGGLEQLIWERYYTGPDGPGFLPTTIHCSSRMKQQIISYLGQVIAPYTTKKGEFSNDWLNDIVDVSPWARDFTVEGCPMWFGFHKTKHVTGGKCDKPAYGIEIQDNGTLCYFSGDTTFDVERIKRFSEAEIIFHECLFFPVYPGTVHTHYEELLTLPDDLRAKIVLMHHTQVPEGIDVVKDGFRAAANRFQSFQIPAPKHAESQ